MSDITIVSKKLQSVDAGSTHPLGFVELTVRLTYTDYFRLLQCDTVTVDTLVDKLCTNAVEPWQ